jgi:O-antigen ligase
MTDRRAFNKIIAASPVWITAFWSIILLANFFPLPAQPALIIGYLWKVEFALAALLAISIAFIGFKYKNIAFEFGKQEFRQIIFPLAAFVVWSGFSCFWAQSWRAAAHHTLLWACYAIFYLFVRQITARPLLLDASLKFTGLVLTILCAACLVEYVSSFGAVGSLFSYRYYKYAEIASALLPVFLAGALRGKTRAAFVSGAVGTLAWLVVVVSLSRSVFVAGVCGVAVFFVLVLIKEKQRYLKKSILILSMLGACVVVPQISLSSQNENTTIKRFASGEHGQYTFQTRLLNWGIAVETFRRNPIFGVGADNFGVVYAAARENYSALDAENKLLEIDEIILAERTHNEYLQIAAELGVVGVFIFGWLLLGIAALAITILRKNVSPLFIGSFAGLTAFLVSSLASSYSFRVPANGACFFFLLALAVKEWHSAKKGAETVDKDSNADSLFFQFQSSVFRAPLVFVALVCATMMIFSATRGASLMYLQAAFHTTEKPKAEIHYRQAAAFDERDGAVNYFYGLHLYDLKRTDEAAVLLRRGIDGGIATSIAYFQLYDAQTSAARRAEAEQTLLEALRVYPRSVFLRTVYANFLERNDRHSEARAEHEKALLINPMQAKSWRIAHADGTQRLSEIAARDDSFVPPMGLKPTEAVFALLDFQRQHRPELLRR